MSADVPGTRAAVDEALAAVAGFSDPGYVEMFEVQLAAAAVLEERYEEAELAFQAFLGRPRPNKRGPLGSACLWRTLRPRAARWKGRA
jgi:hypothetical protein